MNSLIIDHFNNLSDPGEDNRRHKLIDIIFITICATIYNADKWEGLTSICMVKSERIIGEHSCVEERLYISSLKPDAKLIGEAIRKHWGVENSLHWVLDVAFNEDKRAQKN